MLKAAYVSAMRWARRVAERAGVTKRLADSDRAVARHALSLLSIYDLEGMISIDRPWWTYRAADEVESFLLGRRDARVFEFGAGASTIWLSKRSATVHSVEHDVGFANRLSPHLEEFAHVTLHAFAACERSAESLSTSHRAGYEWADFGSYVGTIDEVGGKFDLIVIDGRARESCLVRSVSHLAPDGIIVFDNSNRGRYRSVIEASGLVERRVRGWCPSLPMPSTTSLLTLPDH